MAFIYAAFTVAAYFTVPEDTEQHKGGFNVETFKKFDFLGAFLAITGIALVSSSLRHEFASISARFLCSRSTA